MKVFILKLQIKDTWTNWEPLKEVFTITFTWDQPPFLNTMNHLILLFKWIINNYEVNQTEIANMIFHHYYEIIMHASVSEKIAPGKESRIICKPTTTMECQWGRIIVL